MLHLNRDRGVSPMATPQGTACSEQPEPASPELLTYEGAGLKCVLGIYKGEPLQRSRIRASMETGRLCVA